jgi:hypothetical protein
MTPLLNIGILPDPTQDPRWNEIEALLTPAAMRGGVPVLEANELVWIIEQRGQLTGAATARLTHEEFGEVVLVGGVNAREWIHQLDWLLCSWMRREGMKTIRAYGRKGWVRVLQGWAVIGSDGTALGYEKVL